MGFTLPGTWRALGELEPKPLDESPDMAAACKQALARPIEAKRLSDRDLSNKRVLVITDVHTRPTPADEILPAVLEKLGLAMVFNSTDEWISWSARKVRKDATVWIFPHGGVTYAACPPPR